MTNRRTLTSLTITLVDGGLDPVPIAAAAGDTLAFVVDTGGAEPARFVQTVPEFIRVRIVRTDPTAGKRDVPLNLCIGIIFSEPVVSASVTHATVGLERAGAPVGGQVSLSADGLEAIFQPSEPLIPSTDYKIVIRGGVRDADGSELDAYSADFTTGPSGAAPFGALEIALTTTGTDVDGEYVATLDATRLRSIYPTLSDRPGYFSTVSAGHHVVVLTPPVNCAVQQGEVAVTITPAVTSRAEFLVTCEPFLGTVRITAPTAGPAPSATRYRVTHSFAGYWDYGTGPFVNVGTLDPNGSLVVQIQMSKWGSRYWHTFMLEDVPEACFVAGLNPTKWDSLRFRDTLDIGFPITCRGSS